VVAAIPNRFEHNNDLQKQFWILAAQLPPNPVIQELTKVYFSDVNWHYWILERYYFDELLTPWLALSTDALKHTNPKGLSRDLRYFPGLIFQVLAVALQFLPPDAETLRLLHVRDMAACDRLAQKYSDIGMELMALLGRHGSPLTAVQQDLMRALWLKNCGRGSESWHALGNAIRSVLSSQDVSRK
jgi:hypothetical protein